MALLYTTLLKSETTAQNSTTRSFRASICLYKMSPGLAMVTAADAVAVEVATSNTILTPEVRSPSAVTYSIKILIGFAQMAHAIGISSRINFPSVFVNFISTFDIFNLALVPLEGVQCFTRLTFTEELVITTLVPLALLALVLFFYLLPHWLRARCDLSDLGLIRRQFVGVQTSFWKLVILLSFPPRT